MHGGHRRPLRVISRLDRGTYQSHANATREYHVYILASRPRGTLYVGVSSGLEGRVAQHRAGATHSFTRQYGVHRLVHVGTFPDPREAIAREKRLKKWPRAWKLELVEAANPTWRDLLEG